MGTWWIDRNIILGCHNPTTDELSELYQDGFRSIFCLLDERQQKPKYDIEAIQKIGYWRYKVPVKDFTAPTLEKFRKFIKYIDQAVRHGNVIVHCWAGAGRTGTMAAAYWIKQGLSAAQAIKKVRLINPHTVETDEQEASLYKLESYLANS
jgi:protein tyrosine phosphatase